MHPLLKKILDPPLTLHNIKCLVCLVPRRLSFDENVRAKEGRKETTGVCRLYPSHSPLWFITTLSRFALASVKRKPKRLRRRLVSRIKHISFFFLPQSQYHFLSRTPRRFVLFLSLLTEIPVQLENECKIQQLWHLRPQRKRPCMSRLSRKCTLEEKEYATV